MFPSMKAWILLIVGLALMTGCRPAPAPLIKYHEARVGIGTFVQIDIYAPSDQAEAVAAVMAQAWMRLSEIEGQMSIYRADSVVAQLNTALPGAVIALTPDVEYVLREACALSDETGGVFDITVGPLVHLWRESLSAGRIPSDREIAEARTRSGIAGLILMPEGAASWRSEARRIDLGAIAKGYAVDEIADIFRQAGIENFFIDAGGDVYAGGLNRFQERWRIGIRHPRDRESLADVIGVSNQAVATSGDYEQFTEIGGRRFSHIIDPRTGWPQGGTASATVIAPTALEADALATALTVLSPAEGMALVDGKGDGFAALVITLGDDGIAFHASDRYPAFRLAPHQR